MNFPAPPFLLLSFGHYPAPPFCVHRFLYSRKAIIYFSVLHCNLNLQNGSIQVRNMLDDMLEKNLEIIKAPCLNLTDPTETEGGIKLFKKAPPGIKMDSMDKLHVQLKRPRIVPGQEVDEKSKKFRHMLQSVVVDGSDILVSTKKASQRLDWK
uniref:Uncharacterized protein n=1 Tax=Arundo donax TaxID=35708 RepID=A0A0A9CJ89_ARUDO